MSNRADGNDFEQVFAEALARNGFWATRLRQKAAGQPADVLAVKDGKAMLIDCKRCEHDYFDTRRIEPNQIEAMQLWEACGNGEGRFALGFPDGTVCVVTRSYLEGKKRVTKEEVLKDSTWL